LTQVGPPPEVWPVTPPTWWRCEPGWSWHARPLPDHLLWVVLDGVGSLAVGGAEHVLAAGSGVVFAPGEEPVAGHDPRRRLLVFGMHFRVAGGFPGADGTVRVVPPARCARLPDLDLVAALARQCDRGYRRGDPLGERQCRLALTQLLCLLWEGPAEPAPGPVEEALDGIVRDIREDPSRHWTVAELAARAALSRAQFTRRFTGRTGLPPARFLVRARIDRARQLLTETNLSVTRVAEMLGYPDIAYFSRQYRRHTGQPPSGAR
jgi:AraC family transcriptional regulator of arabinose operon